MPASTGLARAAHLLDVHGAEPAGQALLLQEAADLVHLAAEADADHVAEVRMSGEAAQRAAQQASGSPAVMPQPVLCVSATTPSTFGHSAKGRDRRGGCGGSRCNQFGDMRAASSPR
jgi:hypothetical protein